MDDSDEQGFHQAKVQLTTVKLKHNFAHSNLRLLVPQIVFGRTPLSLHHQLNLYEYPKELDSFTHSQIFDNSFTPNMEIINFLEKNESPATPLSQYFPRKLSCIYNKFHQNLLLKRDLTLIIRNVSKRLRNDQVVTFHEKNRPAVNLALNFTSDFQGGNLHCVYKCKKTGVYYLLLQNDVNTYGYNIWFHFNVRSALAGKFLFVIVNLSRPIKFQQHLLTFSSSSGGYERKVGMSCFESRFRHCQIQKNYFSVQFQYEFNQGESVYFSPIPPYTYSKLMRLIKRIQQRNLVKTSVCFQMAGKSELGNYIPCIKISKRQKSSKKIILLTSRQHPCETVGSFICEQMLKLLTSESDLAIQFLQKYTVYAIPMINPDGVIHGNSRTNLLGYDINRSWDPVVSYKSVQCTQIWEFISKITQKQQIQISWAIDLHGHSKQLGYFAYFSQENDECLIMNHILKLKSLLYDSNKCSFTVGYSKKESLRGKLYQKQGITNSVTIQTSFYGFMNKENQFQNFSNQHFKLIAGQLVQGLVQTCKKIQNKATKQELLQQIAKARKNKKTTISIVGIDQQLDSDSNPQESYLKNEERDQQLFSKTLLHKTFHSHRTKTQLPSSIKRTTFSSHMPYKLRRSLHECEGNQKYPFLEDLVGPNLQVQVVQDLKINIQQKEYSAKKKESQYPTKFFHRESKPLKVRRKIFSEQKYIIGHMAKQFTKEREEFYETLRENVLEPTKYKKRQPQQRRKSVINGVNTSKSEQQKTRELQTIVYPTSHEAGYDLSNKAKLLKEKIKAYREKQYGKKSMLSSFSEIFRFNQQK